MRSYAKAISIFIYSLICVIGTNGQNLPDSITKQIDHYFTKWNTDKDPGLIVGIVRNDSLIFSKGYGIANLEYGIPISTKTVFYIASVSKQFTGFGIALLVRQGKIKLEEDIRVYLPWLADFGKKITINNLLNHTSGIRDYLNMISISGLGIEGIVTNELALHILKKQRSLGFDPGERFSYSNSNYILLAEIIEVVSGKSISDFADSAIFKPLSMTNTRFQDDPSELIENRAFSYWTSDSKTYTNAFQNVYTVGDGGIFTTVEDMSKWIMNFYQPKVGDWKDIEQLTKQGKLNNGRQLSYASGITISENRGWKVYSHGGSLHGYTSLVSIYPDLKMGFIVFANIRDRSILSQINETANLFISKKNEKLGSANQPVIGNSTFPKDSNFLKQYVGNYISEDGYILEIIWKEKKLFGTGFGQNFQLVKKEQHDTFLFPSKNNPLTKLAFRPIISEDTTAFDLVFPDEVLRFTKYNPSAKLDVKDLIGRYYCPELDCTYAIALHDNELFLTSNKYRDSKLTTIGDSHLKRDSWFMNHLKIIKQPNKKISGFEVNSGNVMHLKFFKVAPYP